MSSVSPVTVSKARLLSSPLFMLLRGAVGVALFVYVLRSGGAWDGLKALLSLAWLVGLLNTVPLVGAAIEAWRLNVLFESQGIRLPFLTGYRVVAIGTLFNLWIPGGTGGDVMKLYYLARRHRGQGVEVATVLLVDRAVALFALLVLIGTLLALLPAQATTAPVVRAAGLGVGLGLLLLTAGTAAVWSDRIRSSHGFTWLVTHLPLGQYARRIADAAHAFRRHRTALLVAGLLSISGHVLLAAILAITGSVLLPGVPSLLVATLALLGLVANVLPVTPGGVGVGEAASESLFRAVGVSGGAALVAAWRAGMVGLSLVGAACYIYGVRATSPGGVPSPPERAAS